MVETENLIYSEDGKLFCKWHKEKDTIVLDGKNCSLSIGDLLSQVATPKVRKRQGKKPCRQEVRMEQYPQAADG